MGREARANEPPPLRDWVLETPDDHTVMIRATMFQFNDDGGIVFVDQQGLGLEAFASGHWKHVSLSAVSGLSS